MGADLIKEINALADYALDKGDGVWFFVDGWSMFPFLCPGDKVLVEKRAATQLHIGDVVLFLIGDNYFTHRVIRIKGHLLRTKGDNLPYPDPWIDTEQIAGKINKVEKKEAIWDLQEIKWRRFNTLFGWLHRYAVIIASTKDSKFPYKKDTVLWYLLRINQLIVNRLERIILHG